MFLGCSPLQRGGSKIYQPIGGGGVIPVDCNFSTYSDSNGDPVRVDYVTVAPLYINQDQIRTTLDDYVDLEDGFPFATKWILDQSIGNFDYLLALESDADDSAVRLYYSSDKLFLQWIDNAGDQKGIISIVVAKADELNISGYLSSSSLSLTVNGATVTSTTIAIGASTINTITHGGNNVGGADSIGLLFNFECDCAGVFDFKQNKNNGLTTRSSTGVIATIDEDIAGSTQINEDGTSSTAYEWPESVKELVYATGDIYDDATLLGYRDPVTGVFTAESGTDWELISDHQLIDGACVTIPAGQELVTHNGEDVTNNGQYITNPI